ncbi:MAG: TonB family protein [Elusimicrobia bacterium]|nr:TonB family protein [Elusimicrobiota bacterium]
MNRAPEAPPPARSLGWSLALHGVLVGLLLALARVSWTPSQPPPMEIEITSSILGDGPAKLGAPKPLVPGKAAAVNRTAELVAPPPKPPPPTPPKPPEPPKDWVLPSPDIKKLDKPQVPTGPGSAKGEDTVSTPGGAVGGQGTAAKVGGSGEGSDEGVVGGHGHGGTPLTAFPHLLNADVVRKAMLTEYPVAERAQGHEADVTLMIHIDVNGRVWTSDVVRSASPAFDAAARRVAARMIFSPALGLNGKPVPVRLPQMLGFRLEAE